MKKRPLWVWCAALLLPGGLIIWILWRYYNAPKSVSGDTTGDNVGDSRPRGIQNNNPGNLKSDTTAWAGKTGSDSKGFVVFEDGGANGPAYYGLHAAGETALNYQKEDGINTLNDFGLRWAPPSDNNGASDYGNELASQLDVDPEATFNVQDNLWQLLKAICRNENGLNSGSPWYTDEQFQAAATGAIEAVYG